MLRAWFGAYFLRDAASAPWSSGPTGSTARDGFQVASQLYGRLSVLGRRPLDRRWVLRNPLDGVASTPVLPGLAATVCVMLGSTVYDAGANSTLWIRVVQSDVLGPVAIGTLGLVAVVLVVFGLYLGAVALAGVLGGDAAQVREMPGLFASSIVPIALGYVVAHYYSLLVLTGQQTVGYLADPLGTGAGTCSGLAGRALLTGWVQPTFVATFQVLRDRRRPRARRRPRPRPGRRPVPARARPSLGQIPLLCLMVLFTVGGLLLLFAA